MMELNAESAIKAGGWDPRYAVTLAAAVQDDIAAALVDTNGDEADIDLDEYVRGPDGEWQEAGSGSADDQGTHWSWRMVSIWGRTAPGRTVEIEYLGVSHSTVALETGWWLFIAPSTDDYEALPQRIQR
ncbi:MULTISPECIES: hypothetical protein [unclassified Nocardioides]|uniref:hypothetical protein n=1 Tax=unclassified Nocardioides TaxID=2615069 RepID=UPI0006FDCC01|nr:MULTISPECIES: hypothetical protein [unclassified Nocardioides]KQY50958.1 hypothetical protein ASD30_20970 [Nocardioides sp. Root140]KRF14620.1 hypothetical protein ASH02_09935 [Nocardioides sp. Soil796]